MHLRMGKGGEERGKLKGRGTERGGRGEYGGEGNGNVGENSPKYLLMMYR